MIKANTLEPFIEVDNALNKLKVDDLVQEILDNVGYHLRSLYSGLKVVCTLLPLSTFRTNDLWAKCRS